MSPYRATPPLLDRSYERRAATAGAPLAHREPPQLPTLVPRSLPEFLTTAGIHPLWAKEIRIASRIDSSQEIWFLDNTGADHTRSLRARVSDMDVAAGARTPSGFIDVFVRAIRKAAAPDPLLVDVRRFRRLALRWYLN
jgi:hypothetical protein